VLHKKKNAFPKLKIFLAVFTGIKSLAKDTAWQQDKRYKEKRSHTARQIKQTGRKHLQDG